VKSTKDSAEVYLERMRKVIDDLKARAEPLAKSGFEQEQKKILLHFLGRAAQIGEGCVFAGTARLGTPLYALTRVLSERLQLQTLGQSSFATRAVWQTRRLYSAEGYARS
jgi:hypothetical protein